MAAKCPFYIDQGSQFKAVLTFKTNDSIRDLTGYNIRAYARKKISGAVSFQFTSVIIDASQGKFSLIIDDTESIPTGVYYYDIELYNGALVERVLEGKAYVNPGVTR